MNPGLNLIKIYSFQLAFSFVILTQLFLRSGSPHKPPKCRCRSYWTEVRIWEGKHGVVAVSVCVDSK